MTPERQAHLGPVTRLLAMAGGVGFLALGVAGALKVGDPEAFALAIAEYRMLPPALTRPLAYLLPPLEILAAVGFLFCPHRRPALWLASGLLYTLFAGAVGWVWRADLEIACGCFGDQGSISGWHLALNAGFAAIAWQRFWRTRRSPWSDDLATLLSLAAVLGCLHHALLSDRPLFRPPLRPDQAAVLEIGAEELHRRLAEPGLVLVDARPPEDCQRESLPNSLCLPLRQRLQPETRQTLQRASLVVVFCSGRRCRAAEEQVRHFHRLGIASATLYRGGLEEWRQRGYPRRGSLGEGRSTP